MKFKMGLYPRCGVMHSFYRAVYTMRTIGSYYFTFDVVSAVVIGVIILSVVVSDSTAGGIAAAAVSV